MGTLDLFFFEAGSGTVFISKDGSGTGFSRRLDPEFLKGRIWIRFVSQVGLNPFFFSKVRSGSGFSRRFDPDPVSSRSSDPG